MRLAQLSRKIATKPAEIVTFLASHNLPVDDSSNAKVTDEQVLLVYKHYAPELLEDNTTDELTVEESVVVATEEFEVQSIEKQETPSAEIETSEVEQPLVSGEVIKPVKVELPGLKVVGKIDLPEPKKKEVDPNNSEHSASETEASKSKVRERRNPRPTRDEDRRPRKNSIALQREREARERLRRKQEESLKEKELKTQRYLKKVSKYTAPPKPIKRNKHEEEYEVLVENKEQPKTWLGKILGWFVSE